MLGRVKQLSPTFFVQHSTSLRCHRDGAHEWKNRLEVINDSDHKDVNTKSLKLKSWKNWNYGFGSLYFKYTVYSIQYTNHLKYHLPPNNIFSEFTPPSMALDLLHGNFGSRLGSSGPTLQLQQIHSLKLAASLHLKMVVSKVGISKLPGV